ncbi:hypothetical protein H0H93_013714 [Arthromyces matolae]|nr:hypothetical protein H0H93_013714 [Arthromyces matolae]
MSSSTSDTTHTVDNTGWSASHYNQTASFVYSSAFTAPVLELLDAKPGERIIDFGCGSGEITLELQKHVTSAPGGAVIGTDASESMVEKAKQNGVEHAFVGDIQALELPNDIPTIDQKFDAVFSNATLHWCKNPAGVLESAKRVLKPGGRFAIEMGGLTNIIGLRCVMRDVLRRRGYDAEERDPWFFPSVDEYKELLINAGFRIEHISLNARINPLKESVTDWLYLFTRHTMLKGISDGEAKEIIDEATEILRPDCQDKSGAWTLMYARLRVLAFSPEA